MSASYQIDKDTWYGTCDRCGGSMHAGREDASWNHSDLYKCGDELGRIVRAIREVVRIKEDAF